MITISIHNLVCKYFETYIQSIVNQTNHFTLTSSSMFSFETVPFEPQTSQTRHVSVCLHVHPTTCTHAGEPCHANTSRRSRDDAYKDRYDGALY